MRMAISARPLGGQVQNGSFAGADGVGIGIGAGSAQVVGGRHSGGGGASDPGLAPVAGGALEGAEAAGWLAVPLGPGTSGKAWPVQLRPSQYRRWPPYQGSAYQPAGG